jgi:hypothetical protein
MRPSLFTATSLPSSKPVAVSAWMRFVAQALVSSQERSPAMAVVRRTVSRLSDPGRLGADVDRIGGEPGGGDDPVVGSIADVTAGRHLGRECRARERGRGDGQQHHRPP